MAAKSLFDVDSLLNYAQVSKTGFDFTMCYTNMIARQGNPFGTMEVTRIIQKGTMMIFRTWCLQDMAPMMLRFEDDHVTEGPLRLRRDPIALPDGPIRCVYITYVEGERKRSSTRLREGCPRYQSTRKCNPCMQIGCAHMRMRVALISVRSRVALVKPTTIPYIR